MTIENSSCSTLLMQGNSVTTEWPFTFLIESISDVTLYRHDYATLDYEVVDPSEYSGTGFGEGGGGTITYPLSGSPLTSAFGVVIHRNAPYEQETQFPTQRGFNPHILEEQLDEIVMQVQQNRRDINRGILGEPQRTTPRTIGYITPGHVVVVDADQNLVDGGAAFEPVEGPILITDKVSAGLATVPVGYSLVQTMAYNVLNSATRGAALYRESTSLEVASYPASSYFLTSNNRYFLLAEPEPLIDMLGGVGDGVLNGSGVRVSGADNAEAWNDLVEFCSVAKRNGRLGSGTYCATGQLVQDSGQLIRGEGKDKTVVHVRAPAGSDTVESADPAIFVRASNTKLRNMTVSIEPTAVKPVGAGDGHACVLVGYHAFTVDTQAEVTGIEVSGIRCHRANNATSSGGGVFVVGNVGDFLIYDIDDKGSPRKHAGLAQCHWSGLNTAGGYGFESTITYHVHRGQWDRIRAENSFTGLTWSSTFDMHCGTLSVKNVDTAFYWLPGDETNRIALTDYRDRVGRGNRIDRIFFEDLDADTAENVINMFSVGTSSFAKYPAPDASVGLKQNLFVEFTIGEIIGIATTPRAKTLINCTQFYGNFRVERIDVQGSVTFELINCNKSDGVHFGHVKGKAAYSGSAAVIVNNARNFHADLLEVENTTISSAAARGLFVEGGSFTRTLSADAAQGATEFFINALAEDCVANQPILVNGHLVYADNFYETGCTRIGCSALPAAVTTGQTVTFDKNSTFEIGLQTKGGGTAARVANARGKLWGSVQDYGIIGFSFLSGAIVDVIAPRSRGGGRLRATSGGTATKEFESFDGSQVYVHGGVIGIDGEYLEYNVAAVASGTPDNRIVFNGTRVQTLGSAGFINAGSATDYDTINVRDSNGALIGKGTRSGSKTFDPGSIASGAQETTTVTVTGAALGDSASANFSLSQALVVLSAYVSAADTVTCVFFNLSGGAIDLGSGTLTAYATRR